MVHAFDLVPLRLDLIDGRLIEIDCWLDRPIHDVVMGCVCGWRGRSLGLSPEELLHCYGDLSDEAAFTAAVAEFDARHLAQVVMAGIELFGPEDLADPVQVGVLTA
jgi:hypothetical protein